MNVVPSNYVGSTQLNPYITTYEKLITRVKHTMGYPLVDIEVSDEQIINFINESVEYFTKYAGYTEEYLVFDTAIYTPHTGLDIEKLINSTCRYGLDDTSLTLIDVEDSTYYYVSASNSLYQSVSCNVQLPSQKSCQGPLIVSGVPVLDFITYTQEYTVVSLGEDTFYINDSNLYYSSSSIGSTYNFSLTGELVSTNIKNIVPVTVHTGTTNVSVVSTDPLTYYIYENSLYFSGSSTDSVAPSTCEIGSYITTLTTPTVSTITFLRLNNLIPVQSNSFYTNASGALYKSYSAVSNSDFSQQGDFVQANVPSPTIFVQSVDVDITVVNALPNSFYILDVSLYYSGSAVDSEHSLQGDIISPFILTLLPDQFSINNTIVNAVPLPPNTYYLNNSASNELYRSGESIPLDNGYSYTGTLIQGGLINAITTTGTFLLFTSTVNIPPSSYYLNQNDLWFSGDTGDCGTADIGTLVQANIPRNIDTSNRYVECTFGIVNTTPNTLFLDVSGDVLMSSPSSSQLPDGWCEIEGVFASQVKVINQYTVGTVEIPPMRVVHLPSDSFYVYKSALYQSGNRFLDDDCSLAGQLIQSDVRTLPFNILTEVYSLVSAAPGTQYINCGDTDLTGFTVKPSLTSKTSVLGKLYQSGVSTDHLIPGTSEVGNFTISNIVMNPAITKEATQCLSEYYDYDLSAYRKVIDVFAFEQGQGTGINTLFTLEQSMAQQIYSSYMIGNFGFDLVSWEVLKGFVETRNKVLAQTPHFRFDNRTQRLKIIPEPRVGESYFGLVGCYIERPLADLVKERWVYDYTKALSMIAVGNARGKYSGTGLFGGGSVNGSDIRAQGITEKENLEKVLMSEYRDSYPSNFFVG